MPRAAEILQGLTTDTLDALRNRAGLLHPYVEPPLWGIAAPDDVIEKLSESIRHLATDNGYPHDRRAAVRQFDRPAGAVLHEIMHVSPAEAARPELWNYISLILLPDVAAWRFPSRESYRMMGAGHGETANRSGRNAFGRLWWATEVLGDEATQVGADEAGEPLGEDEIVSIMERSAAIAPSALIAQTVARRGRGFFHDHSTQLRIGRMVFFRELAKEITHLRALYNISALNQAQVVGFVDDACQRVLNAHAA